MMKTTLNILISLIIFITSCILSQVKSFVSVLTKKSGCRKRMGERTQKFSFLLFPSFKQKLSFSYKSIRESSFWLFVAPPPSFKSLNERSKFLFASNDDVVVDFVHRENVQQKCFFFIFSKKYH